MISPNVWPVFNFIICRKFRVYLIGCMHKSCKYLLLTRLGEGLAAFKASEQKVAQNAWRLAVLCAFSIDLIYVRSMCPSRTALNQLQSDSTLQSLSRSLLLTPRSPCQGGALSRMPWEGEAVRKCMCPDKSMGRGRRKERSPIRSYKSSLSSRISLASSVSLDWL